MEDNDGITGRARLTQVLKAPFLTPEGREEIESELRGSVLTFGEEVVLDYFRELNAARQSSGFGIGAIGYTEIAAWASLTGIAPNPGLVTILRAMDETFRIELHELRSKK